MASWIDISPTTPRKNMHLPNAKHIEQYPFIHLEYDPRIPCSERSVHRSDDTRFADFYIVAVGEETEPHGSLAASTHEWTALRAPGITGDLLGSRF